MLRKEIRHDVRAHKPALFIKRDRQRAVSRADLQDGVLLAVSIGKEINHRFSVTLPLMLRYIRNILDFKHAVPLVGDDALAFHAVIHEQIHPAAVKIAIDHVLLLVRKQKQIEICFFAARNLYDLHHCPRRFNSAAFIIAHTYAKTTGAIRSCRFFVRSFPCPPALYSCLSFT